MEAAAASSELARITERKERLRVELTSSSGRFKVGLQVGAR